MAALLALALGALGGLRCRPPPAPRVPFRARLVAHRGGCGERIENTLEAFANAVSQGAELLELDARLTGDGAVVTSHDGDLGRQAGVGRPLRELRYRDLPPYKDPLEVTFAPGCFAHGSDRRIALLDDVFARFPGVPVSVEIKDDDDELIRKVAELVERHDRAAITVWASFDDRILRKCRAAHPAMPYGFSVRRGLLLLLLHYTGLLPFVPLGESFLLFLLPSIINRTYFPVPRGPLGWLLAKVVEKITMRKKLLQHLKERGIQVVLWVLNDERDFAAAFAWGATGVMTDYPTRLRRYLDAHPPP